MKISMLDQTINQLTKKKREEKKKKKQKQNNLIKSIHQSS